MPHTYRPYDYTSGDIPLITRMEQFKEILSGEITVDVDKTTIKEAVSEGLGDINCQFCSVHNHIDRAKEKIIDKIEENKPCMCNLATKEDVANAVTKINKHTDEKFDEIDFLSQFENLNEKVSSLKNNG